MANLDIQNNDIGSVVLESGPCRYDVLTVAGAVTVLEGTILARDSVSLKLVPFVKGGSTNENGIPKAILTYPVTSAGAGDLQVRPMFAGTFRKERMVIDADGDDANIDAAVIDQCRDYGLQVKNVQELNIQDNQ
jgi:hypothetical protein